MKPRHFWIGWALGGTLLFCVFAYWRYQFFHASPELPPSSTLFSTEDILSTYAGQDMIPVITDPSFETVSSADTYLRDEGHGLVVRGKGSARFYPYQLLVWHEVVNDVFGETPLLIAYDPLCGSGMVFERSVVRADTMANETLTFGTTGSVWNNALVLYDQETQSQWIPLLRRAVSDSLDGTELFFYPFLEMSWQTFKNAYPSGRVLSRETGADRDYTNNPYAAYETNMDIYYPLTQTDARLSAKEKVFLAVVGGELKAYPQEILEETGFLEDTIGTMALTLLFQDETIQAASPDTDFIPVFSVYWFCAAAAYPSLNFYQY